LGLSILALLTPWEALLYVIRTPAGLTLQQVTLMWNVVWVTLQAAHPPRLSFNSGLNTLATPQRASQQILLIYLETVSTAKFILLATGALLLTLTRRVRLGGVLLMCAPALAILSYTAQLAATTTKPSNTQPHLGLVVIPAGLTLAALAGILGVMHANRD
jgi:hypothetical protein